MAKAPHPPAPATSPGADAPRAGIDILTLPLHADFAEKTEGSLHHLEGRLPLSLLQRVAQLGKLRILLSEAEVQQHQQPLDQPLRVELDPKVPASLSAAAAMIAAASQRPPASADRHPRRRRIWLWLGVPVLLVSAMLVSDALLGTHAVRNLLRVLLGW